MYNKSDGFLESGEQRTMISVVNHEFQDTVLLQRSSDVGKDILGIRVVMDNTSA